MSLLIGPYLNPSDAARLARRLAFLSGLTGGMLLGWAGTFTALAVLRMGALP